MAEIVATAGEQRVTRVREWRKMWFRFRQSNLSLLGFGIIAAVILAAVFAPQLAPFPHHAGIFVDFDHALKGPSAHNWLGTDDAGRDILWRIAFREILPNAWSPIIVKVTLDMGFVILTSSGLSFLGLGAQPPTPEWGTMIAEGRDYLPGAWWAATFPGLAIFLTVLGFNLLGDGLRDVFDVEIEQW